MSYWWYLRYRRNKRKSRGYWIKKRRAQRMLNFKKVKLSKLARKLKFAKSKRAWKLMKTVRTQMGYAKYKFDRDMNDFIWGRGVWGGDWTQSPYYNRTGETPSKSFSKYYRKKTGPWRSKYWKAYQKYNWGDGDYLPYFAAGLFGRKGSSGPRFIGGSNVGYNPRPTKGRYY